jgi:hypothetical protein
MAKLKFKPTPISRLRKMTVPFKMVGDPEWDWTARPKEAWASRARAVYAHEMEQKDWPMPWTFAVYYEAKVHNERIDRLTREKFNDYDEALNDNEDWDYDDLHNRAERDNAAWDYHYDNYLAAC